MYKINIYENKNGKSEIKDYIKELNNRENKSNNIKFVKISKPNKKIPQTWDFNFMFYKLKHVTCAQFNFVGIDEFATDGR